MKLSRTAQELYQAITKLPVVDAREHLPPEKEYLRFEYSGLNHPLIVNVRCINP